MMDFLFSVKPDGEITIIKSEESQRLVCGNGIILYIYGMISDPDEVLQMLSDDTDGYFTNRHKIIGSYTVLAIDPSAKHCRLIRSPMGGNKTVYYAAVGEELYVFSTLKYLKLIDHENEFNNDRDVLYDFIYNGFIRTNKTLIRGVNKLLADEFFEADSGKPAIRPVSRITADHTSEPVSIDQMYEIEKRVMDSYIGLASRLDDQINIAISGGYDSNLILHFLKQKGIKVNAYSVGGERGLDETDTARKLCEHSGNAGFNKGVVGREVLSHIAEIAEILEGDVYERGVFLQYALGRLLRDNGVRYIMLGEGSDQVFNKNFYTIKTPEFLTNYLDDPYELGIMLVMKKSFMTLSHFGVVGLYPFIHEDMQHLGALINEENGTSKIKQKEMCNHYFDDYMNSLISKNPGSTSLCALFENKEDEDDFIKYVKETNEFYSPTFRISYKYGPVESELDYYLCLEYIKAFKSVFCN